jgi:hypothetical protein
MFQKCFKNVSKMFQKCFKNVSKMLQKSFTWLLLPVDVDCSRPVGAEHEHEYDNDDPEDLSLFWLILHEDVQQSGHR